MTPTQARLCTCPVRGVEVLLRAGMAHSPSASEPRLLDRREDSRIAFNARPRNHGSRQNDAIRCDRLKTVQSEPPGQQHILEGHYGAQ